MSIGQVGPRLLSWYASLGTPANAQPAAPQQQPAAPSPYGVDVYTPGVQVQAQVAMDPRVAQQISMLTQELVVLQQQLSALMQVQLQPQALPQDPAVPAPVAPPAPAPAPPAPPAPPPPPAPVPPAPPAPPPPPAPAPPAPAPAPEGPKTYTVEDGDTLSGIAAKTLGDGERWNEIFDLNRDQLDDANVIHPGQVLKLPGGADVAPAPAPAPSDGSMGSKIVDAARALKADGYHYTVNLTSNYHPVRFKVGCCADFAIDSWAKAGKDLHDEISNPHYVPTIMTWMKNHGEFSKTAKPGDMVFFDWDGDGEGDHTAIVTEVDGNGHATKIIESYDFNLPVRERAIGNSADNIMGYAHP